MPLILAGITLAFASQLAAQTTPAASPYKKGLWLNIWTPKDQKNMEADIPDWDSVGSVEITKQPFSPGAVKNDPDYKNYYNQPFFFAFEGYLKITKEGRHTLTVDIEYSKPQSTLNVQKCSIFIQGNCLVRRPRQELLTYVSPNPSMSISADADLQPGMYQVQIPCDMLDLYRNILPNKGLDYSDIKITFKLKEPGSRRARVLTEDDLYYKE
jgi:hypothetical protein